MCFASPSHLQRPQRANHLPHIFSRSSLASLRRTSASDILPSASLPSLLSTWKNHFTLLDSKSSLSYLSPHLLDLLDVLHPPQVMSTANDVNLLHPPASPSMVASAAYNSAVLLVVSYTLLLFVGRMIQLLCSSNVSRHFLTFFPTPP